MKVSCTGISLLFPDAIARNVLSMLTIVAGALLTVQSSGENLLDRLSSAQSSSERVSVLRAAIISDLASLSNLSFRFKVSKGNELVSHGSVVIGEPNVWSIDGHFNVRASNDSGGFTSISRRAIRFEDQTGQSYGFMTEGSTGQQANDLKSVEYLKENLPMQRVHPKPLENYLFGDGEDSILTYSNRYFRFPQDVIVRRGATWPIIYQIRMQDSTDGLGEVFFRAFFSYSDTLAVESIELWDKNDSLKSKERSGFKCIFQPLRREVVTAGDRAFRMPVDMIVRDGAAANREAFHIQFFDILDNSNSKPIRSLASVVAEFGPRARYLDLSEGKITRTTSVSRTGVLVRSIPQGRDVQVVTVVAGSPTATSVILSIIAVICGLGVLGLAIKMVLFHSSGKFSRK